MTLPAPRFGQKYVVSPFDGNTYCRANGQFMEHARMYGFSNYQQLIDEFSPSEVRWCICGAKCAFSQSSRSYRPTCGRKQCANLMTSRIRQNRTPEEIDAWRNQYRETMAMKSHEEKQMHQQARINTALRNGSYQKAVEVRRATCTAKYGCATYNNPRKISNTKKNWSVAQLVQFKQRLSVSLCGRPLHSFCTDDTWIQRRQEQERRGKVVPLSSLSDWVRYVREVRRLTSRTYRRHKSIINPRGYPRGYPRGLAGTPGAYHLDHITSVWTGFTTGISAVEIASIRNLRMLPWEENLKKGRYE